MVFLVNSILLLTINYLNQSETLLGGGLVDINALVTLALVKSGGYSLYCCRFCITNENAVKIMFC